jgi:hypothetical protein
MMFHSSYTLIHQQITRIIYTAQDVQLALALAE